MVLSRAMPFLYYLRKETADNRLAVLSFLSSLGHHECVPSELPNSHIEIYSLPHGYHLKFEYTMSLFLSLPSFPFLP